MIKRVFAKIIPILITVLLLFNSVSFASEAAESFWVSDFGYYTTEGAGVDTLSGDVLVKAQVMRKGADTAASLIVCTLKNDELVNVESLKNYFENVDSSKKYEVLVNIPDSTEEDVYSLSCFLWGDASEMLPLARPSVFGSSNNNAYKMYVSGRPVADFDPDGENHIQLPASSGASPTVQVLCEDMGTNIETEVSENTILVHATAQNNDKKTFAVTYEKEEAKVLSGKLTFTSGGEKKEQDLSVADRLLDTPKYLYSEQGRLQSWADKFKEYCSCYWVDNYTYYVTIPEKLKGAINFNMYRDWNGTDSKAEITINKSAIVYFQTTSEAAAAQGATDSGLGSEIFVGQLGGDWQTAISALPTTDSKEGLWGNRTLYQRHLIVPEGKDSETFTVDFANGRSQYGPILLLRWTDN